MAKKTLKQQWEEVDFMLLIKIAFLDILKQLAYSANGEQFQRTTQKEYMEKLNAKRNAKN